VAGIAAGTATSAGARTPADPPPVSQECSGRRQDDTDDRDGRHDKAPLRHCGPAKDCRDTQTARRRRTSPASLR
jgi:hypothetical protein